MFLSFSDIKKSLSFADCKRQGSGGWLNKDRFTERNYNSTLSGKVKRIYAENKDF